MDAGNFRGRSTCWSIVPPRSAIRTSRAALAPKTSTPSHALAKSVGLQFRRIQFTSDMLPADIIGNSIFDREKQQFIFHSGPLFSQVVFVDEINRATPKTQSALLEAMEENHVTVDGV